MDVVSAHGGDGLAIGSATLEVFSNLNDALILWKTKAVSQIYLPNNVLLCEFPGFCGMPQTVPHASLSVHQIYSVGQVLHFKCPTGYNKQLPTTGTITCKNVNGRIKWTPVDRPCTNDSGPINKQLSHLMEAGKIFLWHHNDVTTCSQRVHTLPTQEQPKKKPAWGSGWRGQWPQDFDSGGSGAHGKDIVTSYLVLGDFILKRKKNLGADRAALSQIRMKIVE